VERAQVENIRCCKGPTTSKGRTGAHDVGHGQHADGDGQGAVAVGCISHGPSGRIRGRRVAAPRKTTRDRPVPRPRQRDPQYPGRPGDNGIYPTAVGPPRRTMHVYHHVPARADVGLPGNARASREGASKDSRKETRRPDDGERGYEHQSSSSRSRAREEDELRSDRKPSDLVARFKASLQEATDLGLPPEPIRPRVTKDLSQARFVMPSHMRAVRQQTMKITISSTVRYMNLKSPLTLKDPAVAAGLLDYVATHVSGTKMALLAPEVMVQSEYDGAERQALAILGICPRKVRFDWITHTADGRQYWVLPIFVGALWKDATVIKEDPMQKPGHGAQPPDDANAENPWRGPMEVEEARLKRQLEMDHQEGPHASKKEARGQN